MLKRPTPGLRVVHNSNSHQKVEVGIPAGEELVVPLEVAEQLAATSTHFTVDPGDVAAEKARRAVELAEAEAVDEEPAEEPAPPKRRTRKS